MTTICKDCGVRGKGVHHCEEIVDNLLRTRIEYLEAAIASLTVEKEIGWRQVALSKQAKRIEELQAVADAAKDYISDHSNESEQGLFDALAALEDSDE